MPFFFCLCGTHPQVAFPFCLINSQEQALPGVSPGLNHLRPGWVLSESMYMVIRSEDKYRRRAKARWAGLMKIYRSCCCGCCHSAAAAAAAATLLPLLLLLLLRSFLTMC